ncbi:olfactory receptor 5J3-like [Pleurodeles waltl]|uniref:olfactory receptor 5J3-like n=1 Tax=Pleurodeles waltl TaxID=8319 RepID=UPI0037096100
MKSGNHTSPDEFILLGLTQDANLQISFFVLFLLIFIITVVGNASLMTLIIIAPRLHTPMYFLLSNLSFVDLSYSSAITPKMLQTFLDGKKSISFNGCIAQLYFFVSLATTDALLLAVMAYDRYIAICNPLLYHVIMSRRLCCHLVVSAFTGGAVQSMIQTGCIFRLSFCNSNKINHFVCDIVALQKLSCSDTSLNETVVILFGGLTSIGSFVVIVMSYFYIISAVLRSKSAMGRRRAFSTCASHFTCVTLFYGTVFFMYLKPTSLASVDQGRVATVIYTVVIPMLNPLIYALRNKEVKEALGKVADMLSCIAKLSLEKDNKWG